MPTPLILLPPSEGKAAGGEGPPWESVDQSFPTLADPRREVVNALVKAMGGSPEARFKLLGVKAAKAEEATAVNLVVATAPTMPAIDRYTGVLYDALDYPSLPARCAGAWTARWWSSAGSGGWCVPPTRSPTTS